MRGDYSSSGGHFRDRWQPTEDAVVDVVVVVVVGVVFSSFTILCHTRQSANNNLTCLSGHDLSLFTSLAPASSVILSWPLSSSPPPLLVVASLLSS